MFIQLLDPILRFYYNLKNNISYYLFTETQIIPHRNNRIYYYQYFYYLFNFYLNSYPESFLNYFSIYSFYNNIRLYEFSYRDNGIDRCSILRGNIHNIFSYTRYDKTNDELKAFLKCNIIINGVKTNIRQIIRRYDTKTKVKNMLYFNFGNDIDNTNNEIKLEVGNRVYDLIEIDVNMKIEDL